MSSADSTGHDTKTRTASRLTQGKKANEHFAQNVCSFKNMLIWDPVQAVVHTRLYTLYCIESFLGGYVYIYVHLILQDHLKFAGCHFDV